MEEGLRRQVNGGEAGEGLRHGGLHRQGADLGRGLPVGGVARRELRAGLHKLTGNLLNLNLSMHKQGHRVHR